MRNTKRIIEKFSVVVILTIALFFINSEASGQTTLKEAPVEYEKFRIISDRGLYIAGEPVLLSVFNLSSSQFKQLDWSGVYYLELITPQGNVVNKTKINISEDGGEGLLSIPMDVMSGSYFVRGYTHWMRNCGAENFNYLSVKIINPFSESVIAADTTVNSSVELLTATKSAPGSFSISLNDTLAGIRETAASSISNTTGEPISICISVAPDFTFGHQHYADKACIVETIKKPKYLPESEGLSISGTVVSGDNNTPVPYAIVYITSLSSERNFYCNYADSAGKFYFALPEDIGEKELFVSAYREETGPVNLLIDRDFSPQVVLLPAYPLDLVDGLKDAYNNLSLNAQISNQYYDSRIKTIDAEESIPDNRVFFYGIPSTVVVLDDFIKLPVLEEYFTELVPKVSVRKRNGKKVFRITGENQELNLFDPLVMIDGVAIFDVESILAVSPRYIQRLEIIDQPYIRGNVTFGGVINIISRKDDLGYVDLPSSGLLVNYQMYSEKQLGDLSHPTAKNLPDVRNTLYWNSRVNLNPGETFKYDIPVGDIGGTYMVVIRGFTDEGIYLQSRKPFSVK